MKFAFFPEEILRMLKSNNLPYVEFIVHHGLPEDEKLVEFLSNITKHIETTMNFDVLSGAFYNSKKKKPSDKKEEPIEIPDVFLKAFTDDENLT